ncbi:transporter substrate-binding domain-containing protein [Treponema denticola]|uniref:transporter substrate-binding domain-containing protein n=1 Tax=Treponema denticola TaxID=158 RepID=UPI003D6EBBB5
MKRRVFVVLLLLFVVPFFCFAAGSAEKSGDGQEKILRVITAESFYPYIYRDTSSGNLTGFEYEVIEEIARRTGYKTKWLFAGDPAAMFGSIDAGKADTIALSISVSEARKKVYTFSEIYLYDKNRLVTLADNPAKGIDDFQGKKVCVELGGINQPFFDEYNKNLPEDKKIKTITIEGSPRENLELGRFDAYPLSVLSFNRLMERKKYNIKMVGEPIVIGPIAYPFSKNADPKMVEAFNKTIKEMHKDGTLSALSQKYFKCDATKAE